MSVHHPEQHHPDKEPIAGLSHEQLLERRGALEEAENAANSELNEYLEKNHEDAEILEWLDEEYREEALEVGTPQVFEYLMTRGEGVLSDRAIALLRSIDNTIAESMEVDAELTRRYGSELEAYVMTEAEEILQHVDRDLVVDLYMKNIKLDDYKRADGEDEQKEGDEPDKARDKVPTALSALEVLGELADSAGNPENDYALAELRYDAVEKLRAILNQWGVISDEPIQNSMNRIPEEFIDAHRIANKYKHFNSDQMPAILARTPHVPMYDTALKLDAEEAALLDSHLKSIDVEREVQRISVKGLEKLPFHYSEAELRAYIGTMPGIALEGVREIAFRRRRELDPHSSSATAADRVTLGHHAFGSLDNSADITIWTDPLEELDAEGAKNVMLDTLAHEFGHAFHTTLPVALLAEWDYIYEVARRTGSEVFGDYVSHMARIKHENALMEAFADTFMEVKNHPEKADFFTPLSAAAMRRLIHRSQLRE